MKSLVEIIQKFGVEHLGRYYSIYRGVVSDDQDPVHLSRVKVVVPSLKGLELWALPRDVYGTYGAGIRGPIPKKGEVVYVTFEMGNPMKPYWSYHGWAQGEVPVDFEDNTAMGVITPNGNKILLSDEGGTLTLVVQNSINITVVSDDGVVNVTSQTVNVDAKKEVNIKSDKTTFNEGDVGIPESNKVIERLNNIESNLQNLYQLIQASLTHPSPLDGGLLLNELASYKAPNQTKSGDIESDKIFQEN